MFITNNALKWTLILIKRFLGTYWLLSGRPVLKPMLDHKLMLAEVIIQGCAPAEPGSLWFLPNFFSPLTRKS